MESRKRNLEQIVFRLLVGHQVIRERRGALQTTPTEVMMILKIKILSGQACLAPGRQLVAPVYEMPFVSLDNSAKIMLSRGRKKERRNLLKNGRKERIETGQACWLAPMRLDSSRRCLDWLRVRRKRRCHCASSKALVSRMQRLRPTTF